ncbi:hypothetical protein M8494_05855 [Serratia ureilytica]
MLTPFSNRVTFAPAQGKAEMRAGHQFNRFNQQQVFGGAVARRRHAAVSAPAAIATICNRTASSAACARRCKAGARRRKADRRHPCLPVGDKPLAAEDVKDWPGLSHHLALPAAEALRQRMMPRAESPAAAGGQNAGGLAATAPDRRHQPGVDGANSAGRHAGDADFQYSAAAVPLRFRAGATGTGALANPGRPLGARAGQTGDRRAAPPACRACG